ncbi:MAG TPA: PGPGW domain-containing protein [Nocardioides sp.]|uniref:PGPGW domain-containing protein n=1 Tax=Nocardioides sp. TaxID=35761 RepID=UPI002E353F89|nr:PGPGW domain-containing protein [Nocardioides sp.]HEX5089785.1 PGPGW domain-containing protein [Nocardioides sp.]
MTHTAHLSARSRALLDRIDAWSGASPLRSVLVRVAVTVAGPLVVLAGVAMLVLPGPGLVVIALGLALLALEYEWARGLVGGMGRVASWARRAVLPKDGTAGRRLLGAAGGAVFLVATTAITGAVTTYVGSQALI